VTVGWDASGPDANHGNDVPILPGAAGWRRIALCNLANSGTLWVRLLLLSTFECVSTKVAGHSSTAIFFVTTAKRLRGK
jgi:hypothetical protein